MKESAARRGPNPGREFLDITGEQDSKGVEGLVMLEPANASGAEAVECIGESCGSSKLPPWKRNPIALDCDVLKRAKAFLSTCDAAVEGQQSEHHSGEKQVVMNVHMGVFDVNGRLPEGGSLSSKGVIDVPDLDSEDIKQDEVCQIELEEESDDPDDDMLGPSFTYDPSSKQSLDEQWAIYNMLKGGKAASKGSSNKDLVQVISSTDNKH
ncbi:hypothetical protein OIY81_3604 [Cryptosporidium canis]|uniref:ELM2 domain-containing protein n=1 Tax=Cryptosporidium canis TaxID=195482 RepID=A0ABQ8P665_9CRYT|nr:hypothetical protein OIY81_3604 [Cryptosporidium canis]KAJ1606471.1 hypothetical protein OJ252_3153 [Cryptosporidium canis]